jgi:hypothetical protein
MLLILIAASIAGVPEVEFQGGYMGGGGDDPKAIALALRAGLDFREFVTLSALLVGVPGPDASYASGSSTGPVLPDPSGMRGSAALVEVRLHTPGVFNLGGEIAVPLWNGQEDPPNLAVHPSWQSRAAPRLMWALLATVGYRWH